MKNLILKAITLVALVITPVHMANAQFGDLLKKAIGGSASVSVDSLSSQQSGIVNRMVSGLDYLTKGQAQVARALGLKDQADILDAEQEALSSGNVKDKDGIDRAMKKSANAQKAIDKKIAEGGELDEEAKKEFAKAMPDYARGTADTVRLVPELISWGNGARSAIKSAGFRGAGKVKKTLNVGLYIAKNLPSYAKNARKSYASLRSFSKSNDIDTSESDDLLGDL